MQRQFLHGTATYVIVLTSFPNLLTPVLGDKHCTKGLEGMETNPMPDLGMRLRIAKSAMECSTGIEILSATVLE